MGAGVEWDMGVSDAAGMGNTAAGNVEIATDEAFETAADKVFEEEAHSRALWPDTGKAGKAPAPSPPGRPEREATMVGGNAGNPRSPPTSFASAWLLSGRRLLPGLIPNFDEDGDVDSEVHFDEGTEANSGELHTSASKVRG